MAQDLERYPVRRRVALHALKFDDSRIRRGDPEAAHAMKPYRFTQLLFEQRYDFSSPLGQGCLELLGSRLQDQTCRPAGSGTGQLIAFYDENIVLAVSGEMVGDGQAQYSTTDNDVINRLH